jgi:predicted DNA-binding transcriptional regulator AlpA
MTLKNQTKSEPPPVSLLRKSEVLRRAGGVSFPAVHRWMCEGKFPRSRQVGGLSMWLSTEIDAWIAGLPVRPYRGDVGAGRPAQLTPKPYSAT